MYLGVFSEIKLKERKLEIGQNPLYCKYAEWRKSDKRRMLQKFIYIYPFHFKD